MKRTWATSYVAFAVLWISSMFRCWARGYTTATFILYVLNS